MPRCAFLSTDELEDFFVYDMMVAKPLNALGWQVEEVSWRDHGLEWNQYDLVVVRSTWDYQDDHEAFLAVLESMDSSSAQLENPLPLMKWNISKNYLRELAANGIPIIPTLWIDNLEYPAVEAAFAHFKVDEIVIKPRISANSDFTYRLNETQLAAQFSEIKSQCLNKEMMVQPMVNSIVEKGEYSLFYFDGAFSHAILKTPKAQDFRVQEEHGGSLQLVEASSALRALGQDTLKALPYPALYARVDIVELPDTLAIIEVELIEPSLYFNMDPSSAERFAQAIARKYSAI